jgi:hypothetical protein
MRKVGFQHSLPIPLQASCEDRTANLKVIPDSVALIAKRFPTGIGLKVFLELNGPPD